METILVKSNGKGRHDVTGDLLVMGDKDDGVAIGVEFMEDGHHLLAAFAVQSPCWFISQDDIAAVHQCPGDTDPLLLTA
jgi:hypothetical protein